VYFRFSGLYLIWLFDASYIVSYLKILKIANYRKWLRSVTHYTATITGKRKYETFLGEKAAMIIGSTPEKGSKSRKLSDPNKPIIYSAAGLSREYEIYAAEQQNLENLRYVNT